MRELPTRICMVVPPSAFLLDERVFMSLGILKVAAVLERQGVEVELLDLSGVSNYLEAVQDHARNARTATWALTATTPQLPAATRIADTIHEVLPEARVILGGPHITLVNAAFKSELRSGRLGRAHEARAIAMRHFDVLVAGDGEVAIFDAIAPDAPRTIDADDPRGAPRLFLSNAEMDEMPFPARHLVDVDSYHYSIDGKPALSLIAQLGCPFSCGFCGGRQSPMLRRARMRSSASILDEMRHMWHAYHRPGFMLYDDELNVNPKMVELMNGISDVQSELGVDWRLRGFVKAQLFNDDQAAAMVRSGFKWVLVGFESGAPRILENINKASTIDENTRCMEIARRHGLKVKALMSIGHPGDTVETIGQTQDWLMDVQPDDFDVTIITCYPGTPYYDEALPSAERPGEWTYTYRKTGDRLHQIALDYTEEADYYKGDPDGGYHAYVYTDTLSSEQLVSLRDRTERTVRERLGISFNAALPAMSYEHSMGQSGAIPPSILRTSKSAEGARA